MFISEFINKFESMMLVTAFFLLSVTKLASCAEHVTVQCNKEEKREMQSKFVNCTTGYKEEYSRKVEQLEAKVEVTCWLVENIVETCGDLWSNCHSKEEVRRMKDLHIESLLIKNKGASVDIEQCKTVKEFRHRHLLNEEYPEKCSDEETMKSQEKFQTCAHSITTSVNEGIQSLSSEKSILTFLCNSVESILSDCVEHLKECLDTEDVKIISESHTEQLKVYFVRLASDKVDSNFSLDSCDIEDSKTLPSVKKANENIQESELADGDKVLTDNEDNYMNDAKDNNDADNTQIKESLKELSTKDDKENSILVNSFATSTYAYCHFFIIALSCLNFLLHD